jgi:hypothetical protein
MHGLDVERLLAVPAAGFAFVFTYVVEVFRQILLVLPRPEGLIASDLSVAVSVGEHRRRGVGVDRARSTLVLVSQLVPIHNTRTPAVPGTSCPARSARSTS